MSQVNQIKDASDIIDEIGQRLDLKRAGASYKALCPFHSEKSPSFFVNPNLQRYRCFGCGASGDVIEFLEQYEGMTFLEALEYLAEKSGIKLKQYSRTQEDTEREQMLEILLLASKYYSYLLTSHKMGKPALAYLKKRGISQDSIKLFKLGYALSSWDGLLKFLVDKKKYRPQIIEKTGLVIRNKTGRYYDRFRGRIVFPLKNHRGQIVGFSGRILDTSGTQQQTKPQQPKYINTPETQLYHKSRMLYGFSELFQHLREKKTVIITEGEFDVISSSQIHVANIVAIKGSALTEEQVKLLNRVVSKVLLSLDADEAGVEATKRAIAMVKDLDLDLRVIDLSSYKTKYSAHDVDELIKVKPNLWKEAVGQSISAYDFLIKIAFNKFDANSATGRRQIVNELAPVLNLVSHQVEKEFYIRKLAEKFQVSPAVLESDINRFGQMKNAQRKVSSEIHPQQLEDNGQKKLEDLLLFLLFNSDQEQVQAKAKQLEKLTLLNPQARQILTSLINFQESYHLKNFAHTLAEDLKAALMEWSEYSDFIEDVENFNAEEEWAKALKKYQRLQTRARIEKLNQKLAKLELEEETEEKSVKMDELLKEVVKQQGKID